MFFWTGLNCESYKSFNSSRKLMWYIGSLEMQIMLKKKISFINPRICMCVLFRLFITCSWSTMHFAFNHLRLCYPPQVSKIKNVVGFVGSFFNFSCWSCFSAFRSSGFFSVVRFMQAIFHIYLLWGTNPVSFSSVILAIPSYFVSVRPVLSMLQGRP